MTTLLTAQTKANSQGAAFSPALEEREKDDFKDAGPAREESYFFLTDGLLWT